MVERPPRMQNYHGRPLPCAPQLKTGSAEQLVCWVAKDNPVRPDQSSPWERGSGHFQHFNDLETRLYQRAETVLSQLCISLSSAVNSEVDADSNQIPYLLCDVCFKKYYLAT